MRLALFWFVGSYYLRYFIVIFFALGLFFVSIDSLKYIDDLSDSANIIILFLAYDFMYATNFTLPIALLLSMVVCYLFLVRTHQYTALLALGFSKKQILRPILFVSLCFTFCYIGLNATPFAYAQEDIEKLFKKDTSLTTKDLFVKFNQNYVFFGSINPTIGQAQNIKVFKLDSTPQKNLLNITQSKLAHFDKNTWVLQGAISQNLPHTWELGKKGLKIHNISKLEILEGFRPKVLDSIYQSRPLISIIDAIESLKILSSQNAESDKIRAVLYSLVLVPLFVPFVAMILAYYMPSLARYGNLYLLGFGSIVFALIVWGMFFALGQFSITGIIHPEFGIVLPLGLLIVIALFYYFRLNYKH